MLDNQQARPDAKNIISLNLKDKTALHANYMPFIRGGGIYAVSDKEFKLGDSVILSLHVVSIAKKFATPGKVVWMSPQQAQGPQGVGVQFTGTNKENVRMALEAVLGDLANKPSVYHTY